MYFQDKSRDVSFALENAGTTQRMKMKKREK